MIMVFSQENLLETLESTWMLCLLTLKGFVIVIGRIGSTQYGKDGKVKIRDPESELLYTSP